MIFIPQSIPEVFLIEPRVHIDNRGYFVETFKQAQFDEAVGYKVEFVQDNDCLLYTSPSPRDRTRSRMPSSA